MYKRSEKAGRGFIKAEFSESIASLQNPGCGWYHIYSFNALPPRKPCPLEEEVYLPDGENERLALVRIHIGAFRSKAISEEALSRVADILELFQRRKKQMILRFVYDDEGKGIEKEPASISLIKKHMEQLGGVICRYASAILALQGVFVGNWGEMHGSRFLEGGASEGSLAELVNALHEAVKGSCYLAVRKPSQWRAVFADQRTKPDLREKLCLYNDGMFGSATDLGTYGEAGRQSAGETESWSREEELDWQEEHLGAVPNGGEALAGENLISYKQAAAVMAKMHTTYLNSAYHPAQLEYWKSETVLEPGCWKGCSGYEYIGQHLGYRFFVSGVEILRKRKLRITVENSGFANLCLDADCYLIIEGESDSFDINLKSSPRSWRSGEKTVLEVLLPEKLPEGTCRFFLKLEKREGKEIIRFANQGAGDKVLLGCRPASRCTKG